MTVTGAVLCGATPSAVPLPTCVQLFNCRADLYIRGVSLLSIRTRDVPTLSSQPASARRLTRRGFLGGTLGAAALTAVGCASGSNGDAGAGAGAGTSAVDLAGETVALAGPARRVVTIPIPAASMIVAVNGGPEVLAGMNASAHKAVGGGYLGEVFPELLSRPADVAGEDFNPSVERILEIGPTWSSSGGTGERESWHRSPTRA